MSSIGIKRARSLSLTPLSSLSRTVSPQPSVSVAKHRKTTKAKNVKKEPKAETLDDIEAVLRNDSADSPSKSKKMKLLAAHTITSPFPTFTHPTPEECQYVHDLLWRTHRTSPPKKHAPRASANSAETCGGSPDVIDSLVGTILSQNTHSRNSTSAKQSLDAKFGRHKWEAVAIAPRADVVEALKHGGLANKKAAVIQNVLAAIHAKHGAYSLQHLTEPGLSDEEVMKELVSYNGVGPKTAGCVLMFCLGRDSFAVDTHIFRLSHVLGWVPPKADRVLTQAHLDLRIPDALKYGLHVLMIQHGKACAGCKGKVNRSQSSSPAKRTGKAKAEEDELEEEFGENSAAISSQSHSCVLKQWLRGQWRTFEEDELEKMDDVEGNLPVLKQEEEEKQKSNRNRVKEEENFE